MSNYAYNLREESATTFSSLDQERVNMKNSYSSSSHRLYSSSQNSYNMQNEEKVPKVSPLRREVPREDKAEKQSSWSRKDGGSEGLPTNKHQSLDSTLNSTSRQYEQEEPCSDREINAILEDISS